MDSSEADQLSKLLGGSSSGGLIDFNALMASIMPFIIIVTILTFVLTALYCVSILNKWRANRAIVEIRDMLRDFHTEHFSKVTATPKDAPSSTDEKQPQ
ncbi:MAG: hypothetical protein WBP12_00955 [Candidatus Saccharimonas sp.]